jgi:glycine cleavage system H protein
MLVPEDLLYTESHEWVRVVDDLAFVGITDFAQHELGEILYLELPEVGAKVSAGEPCGTIEGVKVAEDLISPVSGRVEEKNADAEETPETVNKSPYEDGWLYKVRLSVSEELSNLLTPQEYSQLVKA